MKTLDERGSKITLKDWKNYLSPDKNVTNIRQVDKHSNIYDNSDFDEEIKTLEAMKKAFITYK